MISFTSWDFKRIKPVKRIEYAPSNCSMVSSVGYSSAYGHVIVGRRG